MNLQLRGSASASVDHAADLEISGKLIATLDVDAGAEAGCDKLVDEREQELAVGDSAALALKVSIARLEARFPG